MSFELSEWVEQGSRVNSLLDTVSERWLEEATETGTLFSGAGGGGGDGLDLDSVGTGQRYLSPVDASKLQCEATSLAPQHREEGAEEVDESACIKTLHQLQSAVLALRQLERESPRGCGVRRLLMRFPHATLPPSSPVCPTLKTVQALLTSGDLNVTVHAATGYDFSSEFMRVYEGQAAPKTWFGDFVVICKRAIVALDSSTPDARAELYARYMLRMAAWEHAVAHEACQAVLQQELPHLRAVASNRSQTRVYSNVKIFLGRDGTLMSAPARQGGPHYAQGGSLCFWVRVCPKLEAPLPPGSKVPDPLERRAEHALQMVYYRRFPLSHRVVDDFNAEEESRGRGGRDEVPPPPPTPCAPQDFSLSLSCRQDAHASDASPTYLPLDDYGDEDEEDDAGVGAAGVDGAASRFDGGDDDRSVGTLNTLNTLNTRHTQQTQQTAATQKSLLSQLSAHSACSSTACFVLKAPSQCAELLGWGQNIFSSLGLDDDEDRGGALQGGAPGQSAQADAGGLFYQPRPIPMPASLALERIKMIACSPRHTLLLTAVGNIFVCGENSEGALGTGDLRRRTNVVLLSWPADPHAPSAPPPRISKVAAGSGSIGSHSMAIDSDGRLYAWGVPYASGHGVVRPVLQPTLLSTFPLEASDTSPAGQGQGQEQDDEGDAAPRMAAGCSPACKDVACGGGFTVAVLSSGAVYSWGAWLFGKLGQGPTPTISSHRTRGRGGRKLARFQMTPARVVGIRQAESVSCGEAHALCLTASGKVYAWGHNACGQLGLGVTPGGYLRNATRPSLVAPFVGRRGAEHGAVVARTVSCGAYHSAVIDTAGGLWTWGARGSACLGHNDPFVEGEWGDKVNQIFSLASPGSTLMVPYELLGWCSKWASPRPVSVLRGVDCAQVSCGDLHTSVVSGSGYLYLWGTGAVAPPLASATLRIDEGRSADADDGEDSDSDDDDGADEDDGPEAGDAKSKARRAKERQRQRHAEKVLSKATIITTPRRPSASWLAALAPKRTLLVASAGARCFVLQDEEAVSSSLTHPLLRRTALGSGSSQAGGRDLDDASIDSFGRSEAEGSGSFFAQRGRADCMIITSGKVLLAHRALLSIRSPALRDLILQELPTDDYASGGSLQPTQLLLPELHADAARALLSFLYTDVLPQSCIGNVTLLRALVRASVSLRLPRLQIICERLLAALSTAGMGTDRSETLLRAKSRAALGLEMPPPTLARDLGNLVGDPEFADIRFIAEGRALVAHRFLLETRCEYFRAMFRSGMSEDAEGYSSGMVDVVVPDTFVGFLRLLIFIYTDTLPDGSDGALLEDLMSADRYNISDMKALCESMLTPSPANWLDLLQAADIVSSRHLRAQVEGFLRDNFSVLDAPHPSLPEGQSAVDVLQAEFPGLLEAVLQARTEAFPSPPSHMLSTRVQANLALYDKRELHSRPFPIWAAGLLAGALLLYSQVQNVLVLGSTVPFVNAAIAAVIGLYVFRSYIFGLRPTD